MIDELTEALGGVDVLVNNSGTGADAPLLEMDYDAAHDAGHRPRRRVPLPAAGRPPHGRGWARRSDHQRHERARAPAALGAAAYCAAKGGLGLLSKTAALEFAEHGITVNAVAPGEIATPMTGQDDEDPHGVPWPAPAGPAGRRSRDRRRGRVPRLPRLPTSPGRRGPWMAGCCRWAPWRART